MMSMLTSVDLPTTIDIRVRWIVFRILMKPSTTYVTVHMHMLYIDICGSKRRPTFGVPEIVPVGYRQRKY